MNGLEILLIGYGAWVVLNLIFPHFGLPCM